MKRKVMLGNEAVARGAWEAGCTVAAGYPGTPSTEILETMAADYPEIRSQWSVNEKVALEVAAGASIAGARVLMTTKHVGLNVAADPLFTFSYTGVNGGLVILNADDPGAWSSQNEQDNRHYARAAKLPMIEPSDPEEARLFTAQAFELSENYDRPVIVRITTRIAHSQGIVNLGERINAPLRELVRDPKKYVMIPAHARPRHVIIEEKLEELRKLSNDGPFNRIEPGTTRRGIITDSVAYQYVKETCPHDPVLKIGMVWPLPDDLIRKFAAGVDELVVVEELDPFIEEYVRGLGLAVSGKDRIPLLGELNPEIVDAALNGARIERSVAAYDTALPGRPPALCQGCPYINAFTTLSSMGVLVNGDIGCYTLGVLPPYNAMHTQGCMGASIGMHLGVEKARPEMAGKSIAVIGDSTFVHSGITALVDMVYNKGTGTVLIFDNRITAMTGHQENPVTGFTLMGEPTHELDLEAVCRAVGVGRVVVTDAKDPAEFERIVNEELEAREVSVIISRRPCILKKKR